MGWMIPLGKGLAGGIFGIGHAKHIGIGDGLGGQPGAENITNDAADAGGAAAVRLNGAGMIVRLDLKANGIGFIKRDHARVVRENRKAKVPASRLHQLHRAVEDRFLDQVLVIAGFR